MFHSLPSSSLGSCGCSSCLLRPPQRAGGRCRLTVLWPVPTPGCWPSTRSGPPQLHTTTTHNRRICKCSEIEVTPEHLRVSYMTATVPRITHRSKPVSPTGGTMKHEASSRCCPHPSPTTCVPCHNTPPAYAHHQSTFDPLVIPLCSTLFGTHLCFTCGLKSPQSSPTDPLVAPAVP